MIQTVKVLGIALKDKDGTINKFVDSDVFDKRKRKVSYSNTPYSNLNNEKKEFKKILKKLENKRTLKEYDVVLAEYIVTVDLSLIYKNGLAQINGVNSNSVDISLVGSDTKHGYQYFNKDKCILRKEVKEFLAA